MTVIRFNLDSILELKIYTICPVSWKKYTAAEHEMHNEYVLFPFQTRILLLA